MRIPSTETRDSTQSTDHKALTAVLYEQRAQTQTTEKTYHSALAYCAQNADGHALCITSVVLAVVGPSVDPSRRAASSSSPTPPIAAIILKHPRRLDQRLLLGGKWLVAPDAGSCDNCVSGRRQMPVHVDRHYQSLRWRVRARRSSCMASRPCSAEP